MKSKYPELIILGAGLSGLSVAYHYPGKSTIFEKGGKIGGTSSTEQYENFYFDHGPHVSFTKDKYIQDLLATHTPYVEKIARPMNSYRGKEFPHPGLFSLNKLPKAERYNILLDFINAYKNFNSIKRPRNYEEWCIMTQGRYFANEYTEKYTKKFWLNPSRNLTTDWVGERVPVPSIEEALKGLLGINNKSGYYFNTYRYPKKGGFGSFALFWKGRSKDINVVLNKEVRNINLPTRTIRFRDGSQISYNNLVTTIPLPELSSIIYPIPGDVKEAISHLKFTSLHYVNIALRGKWKYNFSWLYFYDDEIPVSRLIPYNKIGPRMSPKGYTAAQLEIPYTGIYNKKFTEVSMKKIQELKYIEESKISEMWEFDLKYGYPIYDFKRESSLKIILEYLRSNNVIPAGRYGTWAYLWSHQVINQGKEIANYLTNSIGTSSKGVV
ncbi:MAG: NAD(P)-binding protein [Thermoplasmatales archaeon]